MSARPKIERSSPIARPDRLWVVEHEPSRRFPVYTRGNAGEVYPNVMTPLTGSLIGDAAADGQIAALRRLGMLTRRDLAEPGAVGTGVFGGYLYGNLSLMRVCCERAPGLSASDADAQVAGLSDDAPPYRRRRGDRSPVVTARSSWRMTRRLLWPDISEVDEAGRASRRWQATLAPPSELDDHELIALVRELPARFERGMELLLYSSAFAGAGGAMLERIAERTGSPPGTAAALTAGLGTIDSAEPAFALWRLGRQVAASTTLTGLFDAGVDPHDRRGDPDVEAFVDVFARFVDRHGARGPDEWELASPTWGTDPSIALGAVDRLRRAPDDRDPTAAQARLAAERERLAASVRDRLPRPARPVFDRLVASAGLHAEGRERAKAVFIHDVYPVRRALFELADRMSGRGGPAERSDCFLVTIDELEDFVADPARFAPVLDERRRRRDDLQSRVPPFVFEGSIPDPSTWPRRDRAVVSASSNATTVLEGMGVCPGVARGTARVVRDPASPAALQPDDILVAPITDPAWTPLFLAVRGVVVEVGAQQSHAAIVARELGIPAVVGAAGATHRLRDGDTIEIDGATGTVTVVTSV